MKIRNYEGLLRYTVESDDHKGEEYFVDLALYGGVGFCDCPHFKFRLEPQLSLRPIDPEKFRCKHIRACRRHLSDQLIDALIKTEIRKDHPKIKERKKPLFLKFKSQ